MKAATANFHDRWWRSCQYTGSGSGMRVISQKQGDAAVLRDLRGKEGLVTWAGLRAVKLLLLDVAKPGIERRHSIRKLGERRSASSATKIDSG